MGIGKVRCRRGVATLFVVAVLAITLAIAFSLSSSSSRVLHLSTHERARLRACQASDVGASRAFEHFAADANWLPDAPTPEGSFPGPQSFSCNVSVANGGGGRQLKATGRSLDPMDMRVLAQTGLRVRLAKQLRDNRPTAAIMAFASTPSITTQPTVAVADGTTLRGNIRSRGAIHIGATFALSYTGKTYRLGNVAEDGTGSTHYRNYRAAWGAAYPATPLSQCGQIVGSDVILSNVVLGPSAQNPMGVFYHEGDVVLDDNIVINGTLAVSGSVTFVGDTVTLAAVQQATDPANGTVHTTSFPVLVADRSIVFDWSADVVRISGVVVAGEEFHRATLTSVPNLKRLVRKLHKEERHNHKLTIDSVPDPFTTINGPAIYMKGAVIANRVTLHYMLGLPFALVYDPARVNVGDAPGFFTWRAAEWVEAN